MTCFYKELYTDRSGITEEKVQNYLKNVDVPKISNNVRDSLERPINLLEVQHAIKSLKINKTPGNDGLSANFYQKFSSELGGFLTQLYGEIIQDRKFHLSARRGIITLIEKKEKDPLLLKNWRPISLLNMDLKIYSKMIALRLQPVLEDIIHPSQTGFIKNRLIGENIVKILNMMDFCQRNEKF